MNDFISKEDYSEADIYALIKNEAEESTYLEFKASGALGKTDKIKSEISKDVSAFANSDGGIIIYGIEENNHKADKVSFINGNIFTKEWLAQIISAKIYRIIDDVKIYPIRFNGEIEKSIYIVKIPVSARAPHQASDKRYYKRRGSLSEPIEEYEVRDLYSRILPTKLEIAECLQQIKSSGSTQGKLKRIEYEIGFQIKNVGNTIEKNYKLEIKIPKDVRGSGRSSIADKLAKKDENFYHYSIPNTSPIFQDETSTMCYTTFTISSENIQKLINSKLNLKLFYTSGIDEKEINLLDFLKYKEESVSSKIFSSW